MLAAIMMLLLLVMVPAFYNFVLPAMADRLTGDFGRIRIFYSVVNFFRSFCYACPWVLVTIGIMLGPRQVRGKP